MKLYRHRYTGNSSGFGFSDRLPHRVLRGLYDEATETLLIRL
jgi:hypothetical protein